MSEKSLIEIPARLPEDLQEVQGMYVRTAQSYNELVVETESLRHQISQFQKYLFGRKSERFVPEGDSQLPLGEEFVKTLPANLSKQSIKYERSLKAKPPGHGRVFIPGHLPRREIVIEPEENEKECCGKPRRKIGEEITEELDFKPASLFVTRYVRPKYACGGCQTGIVIAELPPRVIDKGLPGAGLLAHILISKYADHLPLYRQEKIFRRSKVEIPRSTMVGWIQAVCELLEPLYFELIREVKKSFVINADESPLVVLDEDHEGGSKRGFMWVYVGGDQVVFDYRPGRSKEGASDFLKGFSGYLQTDGYAGYNDAEKGNGIKRLGCMAHVRRYFVEALETERAMAEEVLKFISALYEIEKEVKGEEPTVILKARGSRSMPILEDLHDYAKDLNGKVLPKSPIGQAVHYTLAQWSGLTRYAREDGRLSIDNNQVERAIRDLAIGRKNWLFAGSDEGARRMAILYSLIGSCKLQGVEPFSYLKDLLDILAQGESTLYADLTPKAWKKRGEPPTSAG